MIDLKETFKVDYQIGPDELCGPLEHYDDCLAKKDGTVGHNNGHCNYERKHWRKSGVSCMSDVWFCDRCNGDFYWEGLYYFDFGENPIDIPAGWDPADYHDKSDPAMWTLIEAYLCHCCMIELQTVD